MKKVILYAVTISFVAIFISSCATTSKYGCPGNVSYSRKPFNK